ncbi:MAG: aminotransferase class V-fold PLP-dependent enzyme [Hyphomicrobiaceae bacterium]|nr:MAG: aminotransferase class V-fold PLP-dependent enzyme [Hyphomicrobiaceae bacterium]
MEKTNGADQQFARMKEIMMVAGPAPFSDRVADACAPSRNCFHRSKFIIDRVGDCRDMIKSVLGLDEHWEVYLINGTGRNGIEATIKCLPDIFVLSNGVWGELMSAYAGRHGEVRDPAKPFTRPSSHPFAVHVGVVAHDTEKATTNDIPALCEWAQRNGHRLVIDAMSAVVVQDINWNHPAIDVICFSAAKALRAPNGFAIVAARSNCYLKAQPRTSYLDLYLHRKSYEETGYAAGQLISLFVLGLHEALLELLEEGVAVRRQNILRQLGLLRRALNSHGFADEFDRRSNYVLPLRLPDGWTWEGFNAQLWKRGASTTIGHEGRKGRVMNVSPAGAITDEQIWKFCEICAEVKQEESPC